MILIGQYDSPFVRRVGVALTLWRMPFEHRPWSTFAEAELLRPINPLTRVPTLVFDDGEALTDSHCILDALEDMAAPAERLWPASGAERRKALQIAGLACGLADKAVSLFYEKRLHAEASDVWVKRCQAQIAGALAALEQDRAGRTTDFWLGQRIGHADIAVAAALAFASEAHPGLIDMAAYPALTAHCTRCEALPAFRTIRQTFIPPT